MQSHMDVGFLILSPDRNIAGLKNTIGSINLLRHYNNKCVCVVGEDATTRDVKEMKELCPVFKGKDTITSLINTGMKKIKNEWACMLFGGTRIPKIVEKKLETFCKLENEIIYPLIENKYNFIECCFNGVVINTKFFQKVGEFPEFTMQKFGMNDFEFAKMLWALDALKHGAIFKGVLGMRII